MTSKTTPWNKIKTDYLSGVPPRELAIKYKIKAKTIQDKAGHENWTTQKSSICKKIQENVTDRITKLTSLAFQNLELILNDDMAKYSDKIQAAKAILDVSGLKTQKQEITGAEGEALGIQKVFILPNEIKQMDEHIKGALE